MYPSSTQRKNWLFNSEQQVAEMRTEAHVKYLETARQREESRNYLRPEEELILCRQYEYYIRDFCRKFQPPMPKCVVGTSFHYFKRFYLLNSVMDFHPYEILLTCVYLAAKVEEFNVSIAQFVANVKRDREKITDIILNNELLLMQHLNYNLTVHNPFRPVEGLLIDIKTRCPAVKDPECLRPAIDEFLDHSFLTDVCLLFAPSQIALAAVFQAAEKFKENMDVYISDVLLGSGDGEKLNFLHDCIKKMQIMVKNLEVPQRSAVKSIEKKLEKCRNPENNPESQVYKRKMQEMLDEEEGRSARKYARLAEEQRKADEELLGHSDS